MIIAMLYDSYEEEEDGEHPSAAVTQGLSPERA